MNQEKIGKYIRKIRKDNNLSQEKFAEKLGVTFQAVSKWENGKNLPDMAILKAISDEFNIPIDDIINGEESSSCKNSCSCTTNSKNSNNKYILVIVVLFLILIICIIFLFFNRTSHSNYQINDVETTNNKFKVLGTVIKGDDRTSLIINNVNYTGDDEKIIYKELNCTLYEESNNTKTKLSSCDSSKDSTLIDYLKNIKIKMDHKAVNCPMFSKSNLSIEIVATEEDGKNITYNIPLILNNDACN